VTKSRSRHGLTCSAIQLHLIGALASLHQLSTTDSLTSPPFASASLSHAKLFRPMLPNKSTWTPRQDTSGDHGAIWLCPLTLPAGLVLHSPSASSLPIYLFYLPFMYFVDHALSALVRSRGFTLRAPSALGTKGARSSLRGERGLSLWEMSLSPPYDHHHNIVFGHLPPLPAPRPHCLS
jgi:hypothetical protein